MPKPVSEHSHFRACDLRGLILFRPVEDIRSFKSQKTVI